MARKAAASPPKAARKRPLKRSTFSSDSLFGFGTPPSNSNTPRQLSVPRFTLSQGTSPQVQVIDLTEDDDESLPKSTPPIPVPPTKKARRTSPSPMSNPPPRPRVNKPTEEQTDREDGLEGALHDSEALWVDIHRPERPESLAVHARKVEDVRRWLSEALTGGPTGKLKRYRRILVLTGPSGSGKTATLRVLANEVNAEIVEWHASSDEFSTSGSYDYESATTKLVSFLDRAGSYSSLALDSTTSFPSTSATKDSLTSPENHHKILLLEDFPALSHPRARSAFHSALVKFAETAPPQASRTAHLVYPPLVIIISDAGLRAGDTFSYSRDDVLDIRTVLPPSLLGSHYVTQIKFNPIAATFMRKALASVLSSHLPLLHSVSSKSKTSGLPKEIIDELIEAANGDIRSAIMGVQFACVAASKAEEQPKVTGRRAVKGKGKAGTKSEKDAALKTMFAAVTRREHALVLFHLLGKVFYNKRYGDPDEPGEPPVRLAQRLPEHLQEFERRPSKVDVSALHADSPVDASLFSLYIQQNYTQFCDDIDQCLGLAEALSEADGGMGVLDDNVTISAAQSQHTFQHIARSALIALPSPVPRRSQVTRKPAWFAARAKEREVEGSIEDTKQWLIQQGGLGGGDTHRLGYWDRKSVVLDVGGLLGRLGTQVPPSARVFSTLRWDVDSSRNLDDALGEEETVGGADTAEADLEALERRAAGVGRPKEEKLEKGYLSDDDIDDF